MNEIIIKKSKRKTVTFTVIKKDQLLVKAPFYLPDIFIKKIINKNSKVIKKMISEFNKKIRDKVIIKDGGHIFFKGKELTISCYKEKKIKVSDKHLFVPELSSRKDKKIIDFYKSETKKIVYEHIIFLSDKNVEIPSNIKITAANKRWGSCNSKGNICFSWRLAMLPYQTSQYIVAHELAHLIYLDHSKNFWELVKKYCNDYKKHIFYLRENHYRFQVD